jgi:hypothetical protein
MVARRFIDSTTCTAQISVADPGCLFRIPDPTFSHPRIPDPTFFHPGSEFFHPGSEFFSSRIPDPHQRIRVF